MTVTANAKINLTLDITGIRPDGYHSIRSVMVPITLCDEITIEKSDKLSFDCNIRSLVTEDNLCVRAAKAFFAHIDIEPAVSISLNKKIPFPAGLGGGSADAAAVLKGLNKLYGFPVTDSELFSLSATLGSDIPFCLLGSPALCEGRGEELTPLSEIGSFIVVIAIGEGRLSTPAVYREYDSSKSELRNDTDKLLAAVKENDFNKLISSFGNAFEIVTDKLCPETKTIRTLMLKNGALTSHLSGSGPSVYGIFADRKSADTAAGKLQNVGYSAYLCSTVE